MTASEKLKQKLVHAATGERCESAAIAERFDELYGEDEMSDAMSEFRSGQVATNLPCDYSRHYESKSVAAEMLDGSWVGWTYWYGGGKHGEPEAIDWVDDAYDVTFVEETVVVKKFSRVE